MIFHCYPKVKEPGGCPINSTTLYPWQLPQLPQVFVEPAGGPRCVGQGGKSWIHVGYAFFCFSLFYWFTRDIKDLYIYIHNYIYTCVYNWWFGSCTNRYWILWFINMHDQFMLFLRSKGRNMTCHPSLFLRTQEKPNGCIFSSWKCGIQYRLVIHIAMEHCPFQDDYHGLRTKHDSVP